MFSADDTANGWRDDLDRVQDSLRLQRRKQLLVDGLLGARTSSASALGQENLRRLFAPLEPSPEPPTGLGTFRPTSAGVASTKAKMKGRFGPMLGALAALTSLSGWPAPVQADAYECGGGTPRVEINVTKTGFSEGAGTEGWSSRGAYAFARWVAVLEKLLPQKSSLSVHVDAEQSTVDLRHPDQSDERWVLAGGVVTGCDDLAPIVRSVATHLGVRAPSPAGEPIPRLFTVEVWAGRDRAQAQSVAAGLNESEIDPPNQFFFERCLPCANRVAQVLQQKPASYRVVIGVFRTRTVALRSLSRLRSRWTVQGRATRL